MSSDRKAVIKNADMAEDMQQDAIDCAMQALEKYNIEKDIAAFIKKEFDKKYNPTWHCVVGRNFGSYVTHETKHFIYFYLGQVLSFGITAVEENGIMIHNFQCEYQVNSSNDVEKSSPNSDSSIDITSLCCSIYMIGCRATLQEWVKMSGTWMRCWFGRDEFC
ncbi:unnamed protein product [Amoebophrya sp. A25]|nr:unnamed protein product [Amoebophrya sp. A25]|eukprot:GSA25T00015594001.1